MPDYSPLKFLTDVAINKKTMFKTYEIIDISKSMNK